LFLTGLAGILAAALPWWTGGAAGKLLGIDDALDASITIWDFELKILTQDAFGLVETTVTDTWDNFCAAGGVVSGAPTSERQLDEPTECSTIKVCRSMTILTLLIAFFSLGCVLISRVTTPLLLIGGAFGSIATSVFAFVGLGMGAMTGTSGIGGIGFMSIGSSFLCGTLSVAVCFYTAAEAMRPEDHEEGTRVPREQRAAQARAKAEAEAATLEEHIKGSQGSGSERSGGSSKRSGAPKKRNLPHLKKVIFWNKDKNLHDDNEEIPTTLLEKAFREIDQDGGGNIDMSELITALRDCGLNASETAGDTVMKEIDKNADGTVDIHEFVEFFRHIEELAKFQKKNQRRAQFLAIICNCCFLLHVIGVSALLMLFVRMDPDASPQTYSLTRTLLMVFCVMLAILFTFVIAIPAIKITLGPHLVVWQAHYEAECANRGKMKPVQSQGVEDLRAAARGGLPGPVSGLPGPVAVNSAMYGASWRRPKALPPEDMPDMYGGYGNDFGTGHLSGTHKTGSHSSSHGGTTSSIILDKDGGFERYDPGSYWQAQRMAMEKDAPRSFNTMQVHGITRPQEDVRQQAVEVQMLALPGYANQNAGQTAGNWV
jgi:hypothetical protein